ncbi:Zn-ribbon domain-containing OB-fold protein [Prauserella muralis]|uniref:Uncharacterized protein n=1 Tax=Prauserella muralis TaxID=588067 RepID=A0A2V4B0B5_9PSEU|nr:Zn-ribbon domain-containing OB-fold protein [Prauserella muralis]PXY27700.1 hypothetical protein BAY60_15010 [Prauserella muralis]TWE22558.1 hypothetical protein FHX69_3802 [Prauserella muralis]
MSMSDNSFRPDVFRAEPPTLLGSHCGSCGRKAFPPREVCPSCGEPSLGDPVELSRQGRIYSYTVVRQAPPGLSTPYVLGYVDLPDDGVRVMSRIESVRDGDVRIGAPVALDAREDPGQPEPKRMFVFRTGGEPA